MLAGWWNSPRVVTMLAPDASRRHTVVDVAAPGHVEHAVGAEREDLVDVVGGDDAGGPSPQSSPASRPALSAEYT